MAQLNVSQALIEAAWEVEFPIIKVSQHLAEVAYAFGHIHVYLCQLGARAGAGAIYAHGCQMDARAGAGAIYTHGVVME